MKVTINFITDYGVEKQNILNDFWVLRYSPEIAENRLKAAINANVSKVKAWMVRCTDSVFERYNSLQKKNIFLL